MYVYTPISFDTLHGKRNRTEWCSWQCWCSYLWWMLLIRCIIQCNCVSQTDGQSEWQDCAVWFKVWYKVWFKVWFKVWYKVLFKVWFKVWYKVWVKVWYKVLFKVLFKVCFKVLFKVRYKMLFKVWYKVLFEVWFKVWYNVLFKVWFEAGQSTSGSDRLTDWLSDAFFHWHLGICVFPYVAICICVFVLCCYLYLCFYVVMYLCICMYTVYSTHVSETDWRTVGLISLTVSDTWHSQIAAAECVRWKNVYQMKSRKKSKPKVQQIRSSQLCQMMVMTTVAICEQYDPPRSDDMKRWRW